MLKRPSSAGPRYGFGTQMRDSTGDLKRIPGPGTYESESQFQLNRSKGFTMISRRNLQGEQYRPPGPGAYNPEKRQKHEPPSYKIGTENRSNLSRETLRVPGPGSYEAHYEFSRPGSA